MVKAEQPADRPSSRSQARRARELLSRAAAGARLESLEGRRLLSAGESNFDPLNTAVHGFMFDYHNGVVAQADGKILVAGYVGTSGVGTGTDIAVVRYTAAGALDASYGNLGVA